jgi:hypothetical protein
MQKMHQLNLTAKQKRAAGTTKLYNSHITFVPILNKKDNGKRFNSGRRFNEKRWKT